MSIDTLKIARELKSAGMEDRQAEAISNVLGQIAHDDLVTRDYLDRRLMQHTIAVIGAVAAIAGLFKLFA